MTLSKTILTVGSIGVAMLFGGGVYLYMNMNVIAERLAEKVATQTLGVDVAIGSIDISLQDKKISVNNIAIANPPGYKNAKAVTIDLMSIQAETLSQELLNFKQAQMSGMTINLEVTPDSTNLSDIKKNIKPPQNSEEKSHSSETKAPATKVIIQKFAAQNGIINPSVTLLDTQKLEPVDIPDIHLTGIGAKENGILAQEAVAQIWQEISQKTLNAANNGGLLQGLSKDALKDAGLSQIKQVKEQVKQTIDQTIKNVKGLFGN